MTLSSPASPRMSQLTSGPLARFTPADLTRAAAAAPGPRPGEVGVANADLSVDPGSCARSIGRAVLRTEALR
jgi:hypothetical protein